MFYSLLELLNILLLSLEGSINQDLWKNMSLIIEIFFIIEFIMKIHAKTIKSLFLNISINLFI